MNASFYRSLPAIVMLGSSVLVSACSVAPPAEPELPFVLPERFNSAIADGYTPVERWWDDFADQQLNQFVETALVRNPGVAQALARARVAEARTRLNRADQLPQAGIGLNSARQRQNMAAMAGPLGEMVGDDLAFISNNHNASLDISWELDLWGRLSALSSSARAEFLASTEQLRGARQSIAAQVVQLYYDIVHARAQVELSERTVEALAEMSRQITNRMKAGIASPADAMLAEANLGSARAGLEQRNEALARTLRQLDILLGHYPSGALRTADALPGVPAAPASGVPAELLERRPDVRAAELGLLAAGYQLGAAERSFLPSLSLSGSAGYSSGEFSGLIDSSNLVWSIAGQLMQPIFQGGRLVAQVDIAEGQQSEALHGYVETALNALAEVESLLAVETVLERRESSLEASANAAEEAVQMSYNRYLQGIDPFLNVLESQQRALDGRSAHITARHARIENRIALHLALGGGFESEPVTEPIPTDPTARTARQP
ncbi:MAG: efflux transporter outer membrane subunit [Pseudomonas sp.]